MHNMHVYYTVIEFIPADRPTIHLEKIEPGAGCRWQNLHSGSLLSFLPNGPALVASNRGRASSAWQGQIRSPWLASCCSLCHIWETRRTESTTHVAHPRESSAGSL